MALGCLCQRHLEGERLLRKIRKYFAFEAESAASKGIDIDQKRAPNPSELSIYFSATRQVKINQPGSDRSCNEVRHFLEIILLPETFQDPTRAFSSPPQRELLY